MGGIRERKRQYKIRQYVIVRDGFICCYCGIELTPETVTMEHIVPDSKHGSFNTTNLTVSCSNCNNKRGNIPFFEYCKQFDFSEDKIQKYRKLYINNLKIKILNLAKEKYLISNEAVPVVLIEKACNLLKIKIIDFSLYEKIYKFDINFSEVCKRNQIKYCFEQLIKLIEMDSF